LDLESNSQSKRVESLIVVDKLISALIFSVLINILNHEYSTSACVRQSPPGGV
jgi:hypothetical protein